MSGLLPVPRQLDSSPSGFWRVWVYPSGDRSPAGAVDVSFFRGAPTLVESLETSDPFGPSTATLVFSSINALDRPGSGDLEWCVPEVDVDVCWMRPGVDEPLYRWEGYFASFDFSMGDVGGQMLVTCRGAMYQLDHHTAKPEYVYQPIPYEVALSRQFAGKPDLRLAPLLVQWPSWWPTRFSLSDYAGKPLYLRPVGVEDGASWSGLVTRSTGSFDPVLTGYVQGLLGNMYSPNGQFTLRLDSGRRPVLAHRDHLSRPVSSTLVVDLLSPGVMLTVTRDFTQQLNVVYGQGKSLNGSTFSGMRINADGSSVSYEPYAYRRSVHPLEDNDWFDRTVMRKEVSLSFYEGLSEVEAQDISRQHLARFADPGLTGELVLRSDPMLLHYVNGRPAFFPRSLLTAGVSVLVRNLLGNADGVLMHATAVQVSGDEVTLTLDSKYRDQLTVQEVRMRGRDSLAPVRLLTVGQYRPNIPDMLFPWSYADGSGFIPKGSQALFDGMPPGVEFPWVEWTVLRPPKDPRWEGQYVRIPAARDNANLNWASTRGQLRDFSAYRVRMSQAGEAKSIQFAAYDRDGRVLRVPFHVSLYRTSGVSYSSMPKLGANDDFPPYASGQAYPFFRRAWEQYGEDGTALNPEITQAASSAQLIAGWGNFYEKAGFWPGSSADPAAKPTGLLVDESGFSWDLTDAAYNVDPQKTADENLKSPNRADLYVMVYCDAQSAQDVYFLGRVFRKEPGTA